MGADVRLREAGRYILAEVRGVTPPTEPNSKQKHAYDRAAKLSGANFDREFARHMIIDHKEDIVKYQKASKSKDTAVAGYASESLPVLQKHLQAAQSIAQGRKTSQR